MLKAIPTYLIAGALGAGKTSVIRQLLQQKPADERWAVLINEFGQVGLDAALLTTPASGVVVQEIAGGCLCCVNGLPFQVGLNRLLRHAQPQRLLIEPSGLGHPHELLRQLGSAPWSEVLHLQPPVLVLDAITLAAQPSLAAAQKELLAESGLLVLNKSAALTPASRQQLELRLPQSLPHIWTEQGQLQLTELPGWTTQLIAPPSAITTPALSSPTLWLSSEQPICLHQGSAQGWSIGWRWHPSQCFASERLYAWLQNGAWLRAKWVMHTEQGWRSGNALNGQLPELTPSHWRRDSRLELIFSQAQEVAALTADVQACRTYDLLRGAD